MNNRFLFLDFDGVLHPSGGPPGQTLPFEFNDALAQLLKPHPDVAVVVHSTWREVHSLDLIRDFLAALGGRPIDVAGPGEKGPAILSYLNRAGIAQDGSRWRILDDQPEAFPDDLRPWVVSCDPLLGITDPDAQERLLRWLGQK